MVMNEKAVNTITKEDLERLRKEFYDEMLKIQSKIAVAGGVKKFSMLDFSDLANPVRVFKIEGSKYFGYGDEGKLFLKKDGSLYEIVYYDGSAQLWKSKRVFKFDCANNIIHSQMPITLHGELNANGNNIENANHIKCGYLRIVDGANAIGVLDHVGDKIIEINDVSKIIGFFYNKILNLGAPAFFNLREWNGLKLFFGGEERLSVELSKSSNDIYINSPNVLNVNTNIDMGGNEILDTWRYIEYSHILHSVNVAGTIPYFFATNSTSPVVVDYTHFAYGGIVNIIRQVYGSDAQIVGQWIEIQIATDTEGTPVMAGLFESDTGNMLQSVSTDSNLKSTRLFMPLPQLDENKIYDVRGWSSGGGAYCEIGAIILKLLVKARV